MLSRDQASNPLSLPLPAARDRRCCRLHQTPRPSAPP
jgi:hypothetical protein